jgi:hypothetical protein
MVHQSERKKFVIRRAGRSDCIRQFSFVKQAAVALGATFTRPVNQDAVHCLGCGSEEMLPIIPMRFSGKSQPRLVDQSGCLESVSWLFLHLAFGLPHVVRRKSMWMSSGEVISTDSLFLCVAFPHPPAFPNET